MNNTRTIAIVVAVVILILAAAGFFVVRNTTNTTTNQSVATQAPQAQTTPTDATESAQATGSAVTPAVKEFGVAGSNYAFNPTEIVVNKGDTVRVTFRSVDSVHDFVIDDFNVRTNKLGSGKEQTIEFVANKVGTFEYYCSIGNHRQMGMVGKLIVR